MKWNDRMENLVSKIMARHGETFEDLPVGGAVVVENGPYMPLHIFRISRNFVSISHTMNINGDACFDPEVVFFVGYTKGEDASEGRYWIPVEFIQQPLPGTRHVYAWFRANDQGGDEMDKIDIRGQADLSIFVNIWVKNLNAQGFAKPAAKVRWVKP